MSVGRWLLARASDFFRWPIELVRQFPARAGRLFGVLAAGPGGAQDSPFTWLHALLWAVFDLGGGPEATEFALRAVTQARPLSPDEQALAARVLGPGAIRFDQVRIAQGGLLRQAFQRNSNRAFATWHTINMPEGKERHLPLLIHELTHVFQYERVGSVYIGQGLLAQRRLGRSAYHYGGPAGLAIARAAGKRFRDYNREQQGQIAQDYCDCLLKGEDTSPFEDFVSELRRGLF